MNLDTEIQITIGAAAVGVGALGSLISWLWHHSTRLTRVEVRADGVDKQLMQDHARFDVIWADIRAALTRIEDKIDRKQDKP